METSSRTMLVAALLGASAASCAPATTPATSDAATTTAIPVVIIPAATVSAAPTASAAAAVPAPARPDEAIAGVASADLPALDAAIASALAPDPHAGFRCFSWAHERDFSTDCYRTRAECAAAVISMKEGARLPTECESREHASCTTLKGSKDERCFGDAANCGRYRAFVGRNHIETSGCVPR
jgi:hypothetical protein